jgi:homocysteine S-methyltransferase
MEALLDAGVDLLAIETIPTVREARVVVALLDELGATGWLSVQARDEGHTAAGEPIAEVASVAADAVGLVAVGVNCTSPRHVPGLLGALAAATDLPLIAYPNGGDRWDAARRRWTGETDGAAFDPVVVAAWSELGAGWLGGCCRTGPGEIAALARSIGA